ncbi:hypothetical protein ACOME3_006429 [Neoechinorhynchus agilis]
MHSMRNERVRRMSKCHNSENEIGKINRMFSTRSRSFPRSQKEIRCMNPSHNYQTKIQKDLCKDLGIDKPGQSLKNPWGNISYAQMICYAINTSVWRRLTLSQICQWISTNIPYFSTRTDPKSSWGWKNSIRHNLSLHKKFVRVPLISKNFLNGKGNVLKASGIKYVWTVQACEEKSGSPYKKYASARKQKRKKLETSYPSNNNISPTYPYAQNASMCSRSRNDDRRRIAESSTSEKPKVVLSRSDIRIISFVCTPLKPPVEINHEVSQIETNVHIQNVNFNSNQIKVEPSDHSTMSDQFMLVNKRKSSSDLVYTQKKTKASSGAVSNGSLLHSSIENAEYQFDAMIRSFLGRN